MAELATEGPFQGAGLPLAAGGATLAPLPEAARAAVAPFAGRLEAVSAALRTGLGTGLPAPGRSAGRLTWAGSGLWLLAGPEAGAAADWLGGIAAVTDQSDAWAGLRLTGDGARDVLARLVPLDLAPAAFPPGTAARSLLRHIPLLIVGAEAGFDLLVPRSYARTAVHEVGAAMRSVAARASL